MRRTDNTPDNPPSVHQICISEHLEDYQVVLSVRRWNEQLPRYPGMQRGFVYKV